LALLRPGNGVARVTFNDLLLYRYFDDRAKGEANG
jgi:hypothetical protein